MDIVLVTALCNHTFRLPQVILDVGVELDGFGPAVAEDGLADVLFVFGWHGTVAAVVFVVALTVEMVDKMLLQRMSNALRHVVVYLCDTAGLGCSFLFLHFWVTL